MMTRVVITRGLILDALRSVRVIESADGLFDVVDGRGQGSDDDGLCLNAVNECSECKMECR